MVPTPHHTSTLSHQEVVTQIPSRSDQRDESNYLSPTHAEISSKPMASGPRRLNNQSHSGMTQILRTRSDDSQPDESTAPPLSHNRAAAKHSKNSDTKHAHKIHIVKKPLHTAQKAIAHKPHKHHTSISALSKSPKPAVPPPEPSPAIQPAQPSPPEESSPAAAATPLLTAEKEDSPASQDPVTPQADTVPAAAKDPRPDATTLTDTDAPVSQLTEPEAPSEQDSISQPASSPLPQDFPPPVSQLTEPEAPSEQDSISQPASSPLPQDFPPSTDDSPPIEPAPIPAAIAAPTIQRVDESSASTDASTTLGNTNVALAQQSFPPASSALPLAPIAPSLNNAALLNNGTTSNNSSASSIKANFNGLNTGNLPPHSPTPATSSIHTGAALFGVFGSIALIALVAAIFIMISRRRRVQQDDKSFEGLGEAAGNGPAVQEKSTMAEVNSGPGVLTISTSYTGSSKASDEPMMSPVDPVTRFSQGGFSLLKQLESITDSFNRSAHSASPDASSGDDEPVETTLMTPSDAEFGRRVAPPKSELHMHLGEPAIVSPLLLRTDSDSSSDILPTGPCLTGDGPDSHRADGESTETGVSTIASGQPETVQLPRP